ncbi:unnamed protein product [Vitrella brassicaformis CCMP3155]|uniref:Uncharacterized protein n=1 Tax=Vitrella brassicaformis (strain CCMP3155) TaxID=1169540 RepID=A0A0G4EG69_VITBC|nr:unnamed protein product [Vitrella brassicaformis CCMP3155]|eukprot:CEL94470.1 unnamed protein product [Vitrella brassicaformis CCMP3155]
MNMRQMQQMQQMQQRSQHRSVVRAFRRGADLTGRCLRMTGGTLSLIVLLIVMFAELARPLNAFRHTSVPPRPWLQRRFRVQRSGLTMKQRDDGVLVVPEHGNRLHFVSLGCPRNLVDSELMLGILLKNGYEVTDNMQEADHIVVNTCGFLEAARRESLDEIGKAVEAKKDGAKVIVTGCMVNEHKDRIVQETPHIDYMLGAGNVEDILTAVRSTTPGEALTAKSFIQAGDIPRQQTTPKHFAYLKIAEGCKKRCAFCIIPAIKGDLQSKSVQQIVKEFRLLRRNGVKEIILIAQDLGDWGKDLNLSQEFPLSHQAALANGTSSSRQQKGGLVPLLRTLLAEPGDYWLRLLYVYPDEIDDELIELMASDRRLCRYLDMPLQHVSDAVLRRMRRRTSKGEIEGLLTKLRAKVPDVSVRTSLMVGFPRETEDDFDELAEFIKRHPLDNVGIFRFSREEGSAAYDMEGQVEEATKRRREETLASIQQSVLADYQRRKWVGKRLKVLVEGFVPESDFSVLQGRHDGQCPDIDGMVYLNEGLESVSRLGDFYEVDITDVLDPPYDLLGRVVGRWPHEDQDKEGELARRLSGFVRT